MITKITKITSIFKQLRFIAFAILLGANIAHAQTSYTSTSETGSWNTARWNNSSDAAPFTATYTANQPVSFTSGTYNIAGMGATINVGNITVASGVTVNFTSSSNNFATNGTVRTIDVGSGGLFDFNNHAITTASGTGFIKNGAGAFGAGAGSFPGGFTLNAGTVVVRSPLSLGSGTGNSLTLNGGTFATGAATGITFTSVRLPAGINIGGDIQFGEVSSNVSIATGNSNVNFENNVSLGGSLRTLTLGSSSGWFYFSGVVSNTGSSGITFTANSNVTTGAFNLVNTSNTFSGPINIIGNGTGVTDVRFQSDGSMGNTSNTININGGRLSSRNTTLTITSSRGIQIGNTSGTAINTPFNAIVYDGVISDLSGATPGSFAKQGLNLLSLGGVSTYTGSTTINDGILRITTGDNRLPTGTVLSLGQTASGNLGTFDLNGLNQQVAGINSISGTNILSSNNTITSGSQATLTLGGSGTYAYGDGTAANSGVIEGDISLVKSGSGTQTLGDANTYTGTTTINNGVLQLSSGNDRLPTATALSLGQESSANLGTLDLNGRSQTVYSLHSISGTNATASNNTITSLTSAALTINDSGTFGDGTNANSGVITGAISLVKNGVGTLTLGDINTYTGTTTINAGTLVLSNTSGAIAASSSVTINSGGTLQISEAQTINSLTINSGGTLIIDASKTLTMGGNLTISSGANLILNGVITGGSFSLTIESGATVTIGNTSGLTTATGTFSGGKTFSATANYIISGITITPFGSFFTTVSANNVTATANSTIDKPLTITGTLDAQSGATLTTGSNITLSSGARVDRLDNNGGGTITGILTLEYAIPSGRRAFRFLSHPFANAIKLNSLIDDIHITGATGAAAGFDATSTNNPSAFNFNESGYDGTNNSGWNAFTNASVSGNDLNANSPIRILYRGPRSQSNLLDGTNPSPNAATLDWANTSGNINQGTLNIAMNYTAGPNGGWNLLPNPYPSNYNLGSTVSGDRNAIGSFSVWVPTNGSRGAYVTQSFGSSYIIPSGSAFFAQTGSAANFNFNESQKTSTAASVVLLKSDLFKENALQIDVISDSIYWDKLEIRNRDFGTVNRDQQDGPKMQNPDVNFFAITPINEKLAIDNRNIQNGNVIPLGFEVSADYNFTFTVSNFDLGQFDVQLVDKYLSTTTPLALNTEYKFTTNADAASKGTNRFELVFNKTTGIQEQIVNHFNLYPNPATESIYLSLLSNQSGNYQFEMYNQVGAKVKSGSLDFSNNRNQSIGVEEYSNGVYFIKIYNATATQTIKFIK